MSRKFIPIVILPVVAILLYWGVHRSEPTPDFYSGVVEATETQLAFQLSGEVESLVVDEGDSIEKGQRVGTLDSLELQAELAAAEAEAKAMAAQLAELEEGNRPQQIAQARAQLQQGLAELELLENGATSEQLEQAKHQAEAARQQWVLARTGPRREDIQAAEAGLAAARSELTTATEDERRYRELFKDGAAPKSVWEEKSNRLRQARSRVEQAGEQLKKLTTGTRVEEKRIAREHYLGQQARSLELERGTRGELLAQARARVEGLQAQLALMKEGPRLQTIQAARAKLDVAQARVEAVRVKLAKTSLAAPTDGVVVLRNFEPGEMVGPGVPVFKVADLAHPWVTIFIPETDLARIRLGAACEVTVDSMPGKTSSGKIRFIASSAEYTPRQIQTEAQRVMLVFRSEVEVDNPDLVLKPGMPADVRVLP